MPVRRTKHLLVNAVTTAALAATGLVTIGATPVAATPSEGSYLCTFPLFDELEVPLTLDVPELPSELPVGVPVPDGEWGVEGQLVLPDFVLTLLSGVLGIAGETRDFSLQLGGDTVPVDLRSPLDALPLGDIDLPLSGGNRQFVPGRTGEQELVLPDTFDLVVLDVLGVPVLDVTCEWNGDSGAIGTVEVVKQRSSLSGKVLQKPVREGRRAKVLVSVLDQLNRGATGTVVATLDGRTVGRGSLSKGRTRLKLSRLPAGKHRVKLAYSGNGTVSKATRTITVKVVERKS